MRSSPRETARLSEIDALVRAEQQVVSLDERLRGLEREPLARLHRLARR